MNIESGIYLHYKGGLYFVLGVALHRDRPGDTKRAEVIYHPLCPMENMGWRRGITPEKFLEEVASQDHRVLRVPRFDKIYPWTTPNILPGCKVTRNQQLPGSEIITRVWYEKGKGIMVEIQNRGRLENYGILDFLSFYEL